jgi:translocation and assembly module TamB
LHKWAITLVFLIVVVPLCAVFVIVSTPWGRDRMKDAAIQAIHSELGLTATLAHVDVQVFPTPRVVAQGIVLDDPVYGTFAEADGLVIRPSLWALVQGTVDLHTIEIDGATVNLVLRDGEIRNLPRPRNASAEVPDELPFDHLIVTGARITLDAEPLGSAVLEGVNLEIEAGRGTEMDLAVSAVSGRFDHVRGSERLQRFVAIGHVDPDEGVDVEELVAWSPHLKIELREGFVPLPIGPGWHGEVRVRANLGHLHNLPLGWDIPDVHGVVDIRGEAASDEDGITGEAVVKIENGRIERYGLNDIELHLEATPERITVGEGSFAQLIRNGGRVPLEGSVRLGDGYPLDVKIGLEGIEFHALMEQLGVTPNTIVQWHLEGDAELHGTLEPLELRGPMVSVTRDFLVTRDAWHAEPQRPVVGVTRARVAGSVSVRPDGLRFERIVADTPRSRLRGEVLLGFDDTLRVDVTTANIDLRDASPLVDFPLGGTGSVNVEVRGTFGDPVLTGHLAIRDFSFDTFPAGDIESDVRLEKDGYAVRFPRVTAVKRESRYSVDDLFLDFSDDRFLIEGRMHAAELALADFYHVFHYEEDERFTDYQGTVNGDAGIRFTLGFPGDSPSGTMVADLDLAVPGATVNGFAFHDGAFRGRWMWHHWERGYRGGELDIEHLHLRKGDATVSVDGRMALDGVLSMTVAADRVSVRDTEGLANRLPDLGGVYSVVGEIRGTAEVPRAHLDVNATGLTWKGLMIGDGRAYVRLTDRQDEWVSVAERWDPGNLPNEPCAAARNGLWRGRWAADPPLRTRDGPEAPLVRPMAFLVCGEALGGQVAVDLAIGRTKVYPLRGEVELARLDFAPFLRQARTDEPLHGTLSAHVELTGGAMLVDDSLVGRLRVSELAFGQTRVELRNRGEIDVQFDQGDFQVARAELTGPSSRLSISGGGSRRSLALELDGEVDLGVASSFSPELTQAEGRLTLHVNLGGPLDNPRVYGRARVAGGAFRYAGFAEPLTDLNGQITFSARRVLLEGFRANTAGGTIQLSGAATLRGFGLDRFELAISARDLALAPEPGVELAFGGDVSLDWRREQRLPRLHGTIVLDRVMYTKPIQLSRTLGDLSRRERADVEQYDPADDRLELDLRVVDERAMRIQNNVIDGEVRIEDTERPFRIVGTDQRFGAVGSLVIPRGLVRFRNADFEIRRGSIDFEDTFRLDPNFDVVAVTDVRRSGDLTGPRWRIRLHAHGNRDAFQLDTSSEPELSQEDVILLLTVGMTRAEAEQLQADDLTGTAALEALATVTGLDREVQRAVPVIDDFGITSRYSPRTNRTEPQVSIGKRIADRVRLSASTGLSEQREVRTAVEWRLSDQTSVQASYDNVNTTTASTIGNIGVDVRWRLEFE